MFLGRLLGWIIFALGLIVLGRDVIGWYDTGHFEPIVLGQLWYDIDKASLNLAQAIIQRYIWSRLWDPIITTALLWWAAPVFLALGLVLILLFRRRTDAATRWRREYR